MSDTTTRLRDLVAEHLCAEPALVTDEASFHADLRADSLDTVEMAMAVEEVFQIEFNDEEADALFGPQGTFGQACAAVDAKLLAREAS